MSDVVDGPLEPLPPPRKSRGCLFWGGVIGLLLMLGIAGGAYWLVRQVVESMVELGLEHSETEPLEIRQSTMPIDEYRELASRVDAFRKALDAQEGVETLELTADDINALIAHHPAWKALHGKVFVTIDGDRLLAEFSLPLDDFASEIPGLEPLKGRYLNGSAVLGLRIVEGAVDLHIVELNLRAKKVSSEMLVSLGKRNLVEGPSGRSRLSEFDGNLQRLEVRDGRLVIVIRPDR